MNMTKFLKPIFELKKSKFSSKEAGYSLLEILIVLAIMGLLATLVAPRLFTQLDKSKVTAAKAQAHKRNHSDWLWMHSGLIQDDIQQPLKD